jgi:hypothetical protein
MKKDGLKLLKHVSDSIHRFLMIADETSKVSNGDTALPYSLFEGTREY